MRSHTMKLMFILSVLYSAALNSQNSDAEDTERLFRDMYGNMTTWLIPFPQDISSLKEKSLERNIVKNLERITIKDHLWFDQGNLTTFIPGLLFSNTEILPRLKPEVHITGLSTEMLFYPEVRKSPFSGNLLSGTVGYVSGSSFLTGLLYNKKRPVEMYWIAPLQSTSNRVITLQEEIVLLSRVAGDARSRLLEGKDVFAFLYFYGHGIRNNQNNTALVLSSHALSDKTYTGLSDYSLITLDEALAWYVQGVFGMPGKHIPKGLVKPDFHKKQMEERAAEDTRLININGKTRKLRITMVMETCSEIVGSNSKGNRNYQKNFDLEKSRKSILNLIKTRLQKPFEKYSSIDIDVDVQLITISDPGRSIDISLGTDDYRNIIESASSFTNLNKEQFKMVDKPDMIHISPTGNATIDSPLDNGVLTPRIVTFLEESIFASVKEGLPYRFEDIERDINYYKQRYLSDSAKYRDAPHEYHLTNPKEYWSRMQKRHHNKKTNPESMVIVAPKIGAFYLRHSGTEPYSSSQFTIQIDWQERIER